VRPRRGDTRERTILDSARKLLDHHSLSELTVGQIAQGAGVSRSSLYFYFADKVQIFLVIYAEVQGEMSADLDRWFDDPAKAAEPWARASIASAVAVAIRDSTIVRAASDSRGVFPDIDQAWSEQFDFSVARAASLIERERSAGRALSDGPPAQAVARALMHMTERTVYELLARRPDAGEVEEVVEVLNTLWNRGVGAV
jgi:TetR/AcrR family transcriptional regulator, ethionamide resistance regulator